MQLRSNFIELLKEPFFEILALRGIKARWKGSSNIVAEEEEMQTKKQNDGG